MRHKALSKLSQNIYQDGEKYYFLGINNIGVKPIQTEEVDYDNKYVIFEKDSMHDA